jgi:hypothetical protein
LGLLPDRGSGAHPRRCGHSSASWHDLSKTAHF